MYKAETVLWIFVPNLRRKPSGLFVQHKKTHAVMGSSAIASIWLTTALLPLHRIMGLNGTPRLFHRRVNQAGLYIWCDIYYCSCLHVVLFAIRAKMPFSVALCQILWSSTFLKTHEHDCNVLRVILFTNVKKKNPLCSQTFVVLLKSACKLWQCVQIGVQKLWSFGAKNHFWVKVKPLWIQLALILNRIHVGFVVYSFFLHRLL